jgi:capsule polysaccharide modification protein KpsS
MDHFTLMNNDLQKKRMFLFLQGPHGPFFSQLAGALESYGHTTCQIGFNQGDKIFWTNKQNFVAFTLPGAGFSNDKFETSRSQIL